MNIIARAAVYIYDGSPASPIFPVKPGKPADESSAYLSAIAEKIMSSDTSRTTCVEPGSAQEELLRRFGYTPFPEAAQALMNSMDYFPTLPGTGSKHIRAGRNLKAHTAKPHVYCLGIAP